MSNVIAFNGDGPRLTIEESLVSLEELERVLRSVILDCERREDQLFVVDGLEQVCSLVVDSERKQIQFVAVIEHKGPMGSGHSQSERIERRSYDGPLSLPRR